MRFAWREHTASATSKLWVANYYFDTSAHTIVRRTCVDGAYSSETQLAGFVASIDDGHGNNNRASCIAANGSEAPCPTSPAATLPDRVRVRITETNEANAPTPYRYVLTASVRPQSQLPPDSANSTPIPLVALGGCSATPGVDLQGSPDVVVYGAVAINNSCNPIDVGSGANFRATGGITTPIPPIADPYASLTPPPVDCVNGTHTGTRGPGTYTSSATFNGGSTRSGDLHLLQRRDAAEHRHGQRRPPVRRRWCLRRQQCRHHRVAHGDRGIRYGTGGANLIVWQAASNSNPMSLCCSNTASADFDGTIYAPTATVQLKNADMRIEQVIAFRVLFGEGGGTHSTIIGTRPTCPVSLDTTSIPAWTVNRTYPNTQLAASCGSGGYRFTATGLPNNLTLGLTSGIISGTPTTVGTYIGYRHGDRLDRRAGPRDVHVADQPAADDLHNLAAELDDQPRLPRQRR